MKVFISYPRIADEFDKVSEFRQHFSNELKLLVPSSTVFLDTQDIKPSDEVPKEIDKQLRDADLLLILMSPAWLSSNWCRKEYELFTSMKGGKNSRVLPVLWAETKELAKSGSNDLIVRELASIQYDDWQNLRHENWTNADSQKQIAKLAQRTQEISKAASPLIVPPIVPLPIVYDSNIPNPGSNRFHGRIDELNSLTKYLNDKNVSVVAVLAPAGVGKTNLISEWLIQLRPTYNDSRYVFFWTFYIQGTHNETKDSRSFFDEALRFFKLHPSDNPVLDLAAKLKEQKSILILDGIEPLQSSPESDGHGKFIDPGIRDLLSTMARDGFGPDNGLIVLTSRQPVVELARYNDRGYQPLVLNTLGDDEGAKLLRDLGATGPDKDLRAASREMGGHCLALVLLGNLVRETIIDQNIASRPALPPLFEDPNQGGHALRVMCYYDKVYWDTNDYKKRLFLRLLGLFDRPVNFAEINLIENDVPHFKELNIRTFGEGNTSRLYLSLKNAGLLSIKNERESLEKRHWDTHALVRQYFGQLLRDESSETWKEAHRTLFNYYQRMPEKNLPENLESMQPLYRAIQHGCLAHEYYSAFQLYKKRIARGNKGYSTNELGASKEDAAALSCFFSGDMEKPVPGLNVNDHIYLLGRAAFCLKSIGRIIRSIALRKEQIDFCTKHNKWVNKAESTIYLANTYLAKGDLQLAEESANEAMNLAEQCSNIIHKVNAQSELASVLFYKGDLEGAKKHFHAAEELRREHLPSEELPLEEHFLNSVAGARYCNLLLACARTDNDRRVILDRAKKLLQSEKEKYSNPWKVAVALGHISIGRALMAMQYQPEANKIQAQEELDRAVDIIRVAGAMDEHPRVLLTRARFYRSSKKYDLARSDLEYVYEIADRCDMDLYKVDYLIEYSNLLLDEMFLNGKTIQKTVLDEVKINLKMAHDLIKTQGYHLKDAELSMLQARLAFHNSSPDASKYIVDAEIFMNRIGYMAIQSELKSLRKEISLTNHIATRK